jgi:NTE family protein
MNFKIVVFFLISVIGVGFSQEVPADEEPKIGLVLSGGGAKGFAHIGVLKVIEESGLKIDYIGGTSMGAVIGGLYAASYSANEIDSIINSIDFKILLQDIVPRSQSLFFEKQYGENHLITFPVNSKHKISLPKAIATGQSIYNELNGLFEHVNTVTEFDKLPIPFFCITTDLESGKHVVLDKGNLAEAIRASASLPTLLEPVEMGGRSYIDGGVSNNFPVDEMRKKGATMIIGVDVQGKLEKKEDINSVVDVLNQIVNFQMYAKDEERVKELDIHIQPNTQNFSVTSFDKTVEIITEGEIAAYESKTVFENLARFQQKTNKVSAKVVEKTKIKRHITKIKMNSLEHYSRAYILGKMNIEVGDSLSYSELNKKIDRLSVGNDFDLIKYNFKKLSDWENELRLDVIENETLSFVKVGLHYDPLYKSSLLLNFTTKHMLFKNDIFSTDFIFGDNLRVNMNYFVDNGFYTSYGISSRFNSFNANVPFDGEQVNEIKKDYLDFTSMLYMQTTFNRKFAVGLGFEYKLLELSTNALVIENKEEETFYFERSNYLNSLAYLKLDTYDRIAFPKNGFLVDGEFKYYIGSTDYNENFTPFSQAKLKLSGVKTVKDRVSFHLTVEGGVTFEENTSNQFLFAIGGYGENLINNHIPFYGYEFENFQNQSYLKGMLEIRYEMFEKHIIGVIANYARTDIDVFNDGAVFQEILSGYAIEYGYSSILGPVKIVRDWTPDVKNGNWYLSVGFWF